MGYRVLGLAYFTVLPFLLLRLPGPEWLNRFIALAAVAVPAAVLVIMYGVWGRVVSPNARIYRRPGGPNPTVVFALRVVIVAFGVAFGWFVTVPFVLDAGSLVSTGRPVAFTADVRYARYSGRAPYFLKSDYVIRRDGEVTWTKYFLYYSFRTIRPGRYELTVLPRSRAILDADRRS